MLTLELLQWRLHVVTPHSYLKRLVSATPLGQQTPEDVLKHAEFFVNLSSFELLGGEYPGALTAGACVFCALWNMREERHEAPTGRLQQIARACDADAEVAELTACISRLVKAFIALEAEHAAAKGEGAAPEGAAAAALKGKEN